MPQDHAVTLVRAGMLAVIRDVQEYLDHRAPFQVSGESMINANELHAYLLACLITADAYQDPGPETTWGDYIVSVKERSAMFGDWRARGQG